MVANGSTEVNAARRARLGGQGVGRVAARVSKLRDDDSARLAAARCRGRSGGEVSKRRATPAPPPSAASTEDFAGFGVEPGEPPRRHRAQGQPGHGRSRLPTRWRSRSQPARGGDLLRRARSAAGNTRARRLRRRPRSPEDSLRRFGSARKHRYGEDVLIGRSTSAASTSPIRLPRRRRQDEVRAHLGPGREHPSVTQATGDERVRLWLGAALRGARSGNRGVIAGGAAAAPARAAVADAAGAHATHVASIAAGNRGVCRRAAIVAVLISIPEDDAERAGSRSTTRAGSRTRSTTCSRWRTSSATSRSRSTLASAPTVTPTTTRARSSAGSTPRWLAPGAASASPPATRTGAGRVRGRHGLHHGPHPHQRQDRGP